MSRRRYVAPHLRQISTIRTTSNTSIKSINIARRRLARDLIELERADIASIAAHPIDDNIFEWHVNIKPTDGVYCGVYLHFIMTFPDSYPSHPPNVFVCTPISHPNIFNSFLCLSMLRPRTGHVPYEGWSSAYSAVSILMQLQSFLFADKIDQDGGYQANAQLSLDNVQSSINTCKTFQCNQCSHSHDTPWPKVKEGSQHTSIKMLPIGFDAEHVMIHNSFCQTTHTHWVAAKCELGYNKGKILYEAHIHMVGTKGNTRRGLCRFGFGSKAADICGRNTESFGYDGTGKYSAHGRYDDFGESFTENDTITVAVDFDAMRIYFAKNGRIMESNRVLSVPKSLRGKPLFPLTAFKNARIEFNFGAPRKPCEWLVHNGFKSLQQIIRKQDGDDMKHEDCNVNAVDWHSHYIIPELWVVIFAGLSFEETFRAQFVCTQWYECIHKYNMMERFNEMRCYYTKAKLEECRFGHQIFGFGLSIRSSNVSGLGIAIHSQMDILSLDAWKNGCRTGVWGEELTHFLPLVMNAKHAIIAHTAIQHHVQQLGSMFGTTRKCNANELERLINRRPCLKLVDTLVTMMNLIVVQFVNGYENDHHTVSMVMCEKVVLGFCAFHHLLLYLVSQNKETITHFANKTVSLFMNDGSDKKTTRDLGKFLIYLMISSQYGWNDVSQSFVQEALTRGVLFMVRDVKYRKYDTTNVVQKRLENTFNAYAISRRLIMFQVWFMRNCASETLKGYNGRLGRPDSKVRKAIFNKTKCILNSTSWYDFFNELQIVMETDEAIDRLLRFAIYDSDSKGYHRHSNCEGALQFVNISIGAEGKNNNASTVNNKTVSKYSWRNTYNRSTYDAYDAQPMRPEGVRPIRHNGIRPNGIRPIATIRPNGIRPNATRPERQYHAQPVTMSKGQRRKLRKKNSKKRRK